MNCEQGLREFDPITQKRKYIVGIYATDGVETAYQQYNLTFQDYLNEVVGKRFEPTIEFSLTATNRPLRDWLDKGEEIDFMYTDTGIYSCIGTEVGAQPLATTVARLKSRGREYELDMFAGTSFGKDDIQAFSYAQAQAILIVVFYCSHSWVCRNNDGIGEQSRNQ